jgi:hypothetical protein
MATIFNQSIDISENYKGHIELLDDSDSNWYDPDELLDWTVSTIVDTEKHYGTRGSKKKTITGNSSVFEFRVKKTADFYDDLATPIKRRTLSYWKSLIYATPPVLPIISLRGVSETNALSDRFVVDEFTASIENIDETRDDSKGTEEISVSGEIITHTSNRRIGSAP